MMLVITAPLASVGLATIVYLGLLFSTLSKRLNAVAKRAEYYRWFWIANSLIAVAAASQVIRATAKLAPGQAYPFVLSPWFALASFHVPLALGTTVDLLLVWYYWRWLLKESLR